MARLVLIVVTVMVGAVAPAQDAAEIDMTDPAAVVQAYLRACRDGDDKTVMSLILPDEAKLPQLREMAAASEEQRRGIPDFVNYLGELLLLPIGVEWDRELGAGATEGGEARFPFKTAAVFEGTVVLARQEDGTWRVKLIDSLRASARGGESALAANLTGSPRGAPGQDSSAWESQRNLRELAQAMVQYAGDHNNTLPPANRWVDELERYVLDPSRFKSPTKPDLEYGYAMNDELSGKTLPDDWSERRAMVVLFEWLGGERNAHAAAGDLSTLKSPREDGTIVIATADGDATILQPGQSLAERFEAEQATSTCSGNLQQLVRAARKFAVDHDGLLPSADTWESDLAPYIDPVTVRQDDRQDEWRSREKLRALYKAFQEYAKDHGALPEADRWTDEIEPYLLDPVAFKCPALPDLAHGYAMNEELSGQALPAGWQARQATLLLSEWTGGERNAHATPLQLAQADPPRPSGIRVVMAASGQAVSLPNDMTFEELIQADGLAQTCRDHLAKLVAALRKYVREHEGGLPAAETWQEDLALYLLEIGDPGDLFTCPAAPELDFAYAYNEEIAGKRVAELPEGGRAIVFFESDLNVPNAHAPAPKTGGGPPRHMGSWNDAGGVFAQLAYLDGSAETGRMQPVTESRPGALALLLTCPAAPEIEHAYAINREVAGNKAADLPDHERTVLFFESNLNVPNAAGDPGRDAANPPRHASPRSGDDRRFNHFGYLAGQTNRLYLPAPEATRE